MEQRLRALLERFEYQSSTGLGKRSLQRHHIDALVAVLLPFIEDEASDYNFDRETRL